MLKWTVMNKRNTNIGLPSADENLELNNKENNKNYETPKRRDIATMNSVQRRHTLGKNSKLKTDKINGFRRRRRHSTANHSEYELDDKRWDKENNFFNSTPKTKDSISYVRFDSIALRDVSNITPTNNATPPNRYPICNKRCRSQPHENKFITKRHTKNDSITDILSLTPTRAMKHSSISKRLCPQSVQKNKKVRRSLSIMQDSSKQTELFKNSETSSNRFNLLNLDKDFVKNITETIPETNIIENTLKNTAKDQTIFPATLPTFQIEYSPCPMRPTQSLLSVKNSQTITNFPPYKSLALLPNMNECPSIKKSKVDNFNDFLTQISTITSPEDVGMQFTGIKSLQKVSVTPLTNRLADLRFNQRLDNNSIDSDEFDKLPLEQMVEALLETTKRCESTPITENDLNETQEDNYVNFEQEKLILKTKSLENNSPVFNEREVKTPQEMPIEINLESLQLNSLRKGVKRSSDITDNSTDSLENFTLKRQKCVRRKKSELREANNNGLTLNNGIPSPNSTTKNANKNNSLTKSSQYNMISVDQNYKRRPLILDAVPLTPKSDLNIEELLQENLEETPLSMFPGYRKIHSRENMLTLPMGIPSPGTPLSSRKTGSVVRKLSPKILSETFTIDPDRSQVISFQKEISPPSIQVKNQNKHFQDLLGTPYSEIWTPYEDDKRTKSRRCLSFISPDSSLDRSSERQARRCKVKEFLAKGTIELTLQYQNGRLLVHVFGCKDLNRGNDKIINAYVKVSLISHNGDESVTKERSSGGLHRTAVHKNSTNPYFDQMFCFNILTKLDMSKRIQIAVWHRDRDNRRSEILGCTTFPVKNVIKKEISGSFKLQTHSTNRAQQHSAPSGQQHCNTNISIPQHQEETTTNITSTQVVPLKQNTTVTNNTKLAQQRTNTNDQLKASTNDEADLQKTSELQINPTKLATVSVHPNQIPATTTKSTIMGDFSQSSVEEVISLDDSQTDFFTQEISKTSSKKKLNEQQKVADENLFLRYLELDPTEGPEAIPAALQRKASGNKSGRTPFTTTRRLVRPPDSGFGFSVVWTHPPRVERVEHGLPAEKAGILPGDYIIFVDKHNVVMMPEVDILNLIRSYGNQLVLEIYRRQGNTAIAGSSTNQNGLLSSSRSASITIIPGIAGSTSILPTTLGASITAGIATGTGSTTTTSTTVHQQLQQNPPPRSSTACSTNTTSEYNRRRLHLPQVTFSSENQEGNEKNAPVGGTTNAEDIRKRTLFQLIHREQQYTTSMQFAVGRFVAPLAERTDLLAPSDHRALFQNSQDLLQLSEEILDNILLEDGEPQTHLIPKIYHEKISIMTSLYKKYCNGLKKADCILVNKTRNTNSEFVRFLHNPAIPRRRPDITGFIHKPLEHYREVLKLLQTILANTKSNQDDYQIISKVVQELQTSYRDITSNAGLMEPTGEGRPLLTIQDLESRLVFTRCKPFVLNVPGRQWIFGGDLSRVEGRNIRPYWALLFSDILLFAKVSRDRVLFITEEPLPLINITDIFFNIRKKANEFRINVSPGGKLAESPTAHCGPDLSRTPRKTARRRCIVLRTPTHELKAVWQNLLQKQVYLVHSGMGLTPLSSPMDSPDAPITSSVATLQSADSYNCRRQQTLSHQQNDMSSSSIINTQKQLNDLIEHKCRQMGKSTTNKGSALHLAQWMKGELGVRNLILERNQNDYINTDEPEPEMWTEEELRRRSLELNLLDSIDTVVNKTNVTDNNIYRGKDNLDNRCDSVLMSDVDGSPSKSTTSGSQITVRSSPIVPEKVPVCRQCHQTCLTHNSPNSNNKTNNNLSPKQCNQQHTCNTALNNNQIDNSNENEDPYSDDWGSLMLMGLSVINPTTSLLQMDPFAPPKQETPKISVSPPSPDTIKQNEPLTQNGNCSPKITPTRRLQIQKTISEDESPEDSPQTEEPPYLVMVPKNPGLKRYGTWSSLGRIPSDELVEAPDGINGDLSSSDEDEDEEEDDDDDAPIAQSLFGWTTRAGSFVAEKMAIFEKFGEESRAALDRYLRPSETKSDIDTEFGTVSSTGGNLDEEYENSGATSGEEIWGTPTSGGELDEMPTFPNLQSESLSDSTSSANCDDDDLIMDELLMAPPITASAVRGLLPRRRLEPLMEEDDTESCTTTSPAINQNDITPSPDQVKCKMDRNLNRGSEYGDVADTSCAAAVPSRTELLMRPTTENRRQKQPPPPPPRRIHKSQQHHQQQSAVVSNSSGKTSSIISSTVGNKTGDKTLTAQLHTSIEEAVKIEAPTSFAQQDHQQKTKNIKQTAATKNQPLLIRTSSYKHIIEDECNLLSALPPSPDISVNHNNNVTNKMKPLYSKKISMIVNNPNIEHNIIVNPSSYRSKSTRLLEFLSGRRQDDILIGLDTCNTVDSKTPHNSPGRSRQILKLFSRDADGNHITTFSQRPFSPRRQNVSLLSFKQIDDN